ncbi:MAG: hypothetical protein AMXMBFR78_11910 [Rubrivivax sp.]
MASSGHRPLRLVLDTNVVIAGLLWRGPPRRLIEMAVEGGKVELFGSPMLIDELTRTLAYDRLARRIDKMGANIPTLIEHYALLVSLVVPASVPHLVAGDADDDHVIAAAVAARAELIVTGDRKHLLPLGAHQDIAIITAREAVERLEAQRTR